jgi:tetratricopeptide (TPR) repeat protein
MDEHLEYIDDYFQKQLSDAERLRFEQRCLSDAEFAKDVALYINSRQALREILLEEKKKQWRPLVGQNTGEMEDATPADRPQTPVRTIQYKKWIGLAVAASVVIALIVYPLMTRDSAKDTIHSYVATDLGLISSTMDGSRDSMQLGIIAYNAKKYPEAVQIFGSLVSAYPENADALKYLGQAQLLSHDYDKALATFSLLAAKPGLYSNAGLFLQGVTLVERGAAGDEAAAKKLFQRVVDEGLEGEREAAVWLQKMD